MNNLNIINIFIVLLVAYQDHMHFGLASSRIQNYSNKRRIQSCLTYQRGGGYQREALISMWIPKCAALIRGNTMLRNDCHNGVLSAHMIRFSIRIVKTCSESTIQVNCIRPQKIFQTIKRKYHQNEPVVLGLSEEFDVFCFDSTNMVSCPCRQQRLPSPYLTFLVYLYF